MTTPLTDATSRPQAHFAPAENWMNDPNGLIHHDGLYHLYFQHNPESADWGNMSWGHATSRDLRTWQEHAVALRFDHDEQIFSGSIVFDATNSSGLGVDGRAPLVALYTSATDRGQAQALAHSLDGGYTWTKHGVVLDRGTADFRDPKVFRHGEEWILVAVEALDRQVHLFRSDDLLDWHPLSVFGPFGAPEGMWECPDLFAVGDRWVLALSVNPGHPSGGSGMQYIVGDFDGTTFTASRWDWLDHGHDYYAGVTFSGMEEPVMLAWLSNWSYAREVPTYPWRGSMALPRRLALRGDVLLQLPAVDVDRPPAFSCEDTPIPVGGFELPAEAQGSALRIELTMRPAGAAVELHVRAGAEAEDAIVVRYDDGMLTLDRSGASNTSFSADFGLASSAPVELRDGVLDLDVWVDSTSVEVFADGGAVTISDQIMTADERTGVRIGASRPGAAIESLAVTGLDLG
ncbi:glycoside hydrolase family 32 protein [Microbacterium foliorum]|uniref:glycoside hydrolase family 32 protein n=1 Tax=Microbacterium foliorum TaxID=104336 RepID=UPI001D8A2541|nr:glycoside hydrolase family 32 protein [Microbacterium foliorum]CAH0170108.1 Levanase [Microbacterium foliorum]CAH0193515.1 Levanase [Microbacterium foliorum]